MNSFDTPRLGKTSASINASPLVGVLGFALSFVCVAFLVWNELNARRADRTLVQGAASVTPITPEAIDPTHEGALVHIVGKATAASPVADPDWGVSVPGLRLDRRVSMYQHVRETRSGSSGSSSYRYVAQWSDDPEDSSGFPIGLSNPKFPVEDASFHAADARMGAFSLGEAVLDKAGEAKLLSLDGGLQDAVRAAVGRQNLGRPVQVAAGGVYLGADPSRPRIGDVKIAFAVVPTGGLFSVAAAQTGSTLTPHGDVAHPLLLVKPGALSADALFEAARGENRLLLWIHRGGGLLFLLIGSAMVFFSARAFRRSRRN